MEVIERLLARVEIVEQNYTSACWVWLGYKLKNGYGRIGVAGRTMGLVHRVAYEHLVGPIPDGLEIDHLCHTVDKCAGGVTCPHRACCNPEHLEAVTKSTNVRRSHAPALAAAHQLAKTHCPAGHAYAGPNLYVYPDGRRECRECHRRADASRQRRAKF